MLRPKHITAPFTPLFMSTVAAHIVKSYTREELAETVIWVPSPRQVQALSKAITQAADGVVMLPAILPLHTASLQSQCAMEGWPKYPPAPVAAVHAFLLKHCRQAFPHQPFARYMAMAEELAQLLNQFMANGVTQESMEACVPHGLAEHWRTHKQFLAVITTAYPEWLNKNNYTDTHVYQQQLVHHIAARYRDGVEHPVYAVGFTDTTPTGVSLLQAISACSTGHIIMPIWPEKEGEEQPLLPSDAAYAPLKLIEKLHIPADAFTLLPAIHEPSPTLEYTYIPATTSTQEVEVVSLILKKYALIAPEKVCAVITNNRAWVEKLKDQCAVMGIKVDDSGGVPLNQTLLGHFIMGWCACLTSDITSRALSAWLRHPWWNMRTEDVAAFEDTYLRDVALHKSRAIYTNTQLPTAFRAALKAGWKVEQAPLTDWLHICEQLLESVSDTISPAEHHAWAECVQYIHTASGAVASLTVMQSAVYIENIMRNIVVRQPAQSKTLYIWGPLEARLQHMDVAILVDMNEGSWPRLPAPNPWLNRRFYEQLNLPDPLKPVGMAMLDATYLLNVKEVYLTRCTQGVESATEESRIIGNLKAVVGDTEWYAVERRGKAWLEAHDSWWQYEEKTAEVLLPPAPATLSLPVSMKPTTLSATALEMLLTCPYKFALRYGLGLKPLEHFDKEYTSAERGTIIHTLCQAFLEQVEGYPAPFPSRVTTATIKDAEAHMATLIPIALAPLPPKEFTMWQPRLWLIMEAWLTHLAATPQERHIAALEQEGKAALNNITFFTRADRVDTVGNAHVVIDYKTGKVPTFAEILKGEKPQMALEAWVHSKGGFGDNAKLADAEIHAMASSGTPFDVTEILPKWEGELPFITAVDNALTDVVEAYNKPSVTFTAVPSKAACMYCDYAGICRKTEWEVSHE